MSARPRKGRRTGDDNQPPTTAHDENVDPEEGLGLGKAAACGVSATPLPCHPSRIAGPSARATRSRAQASGATGNVVDVSSEPAAAGATGDGAPSTSLRSSRASASKKRGAPKEQLDAPVAGEPSASATVICGPTGDGAGTLPMGCAGAALVAASNAAAATSSENLKRGKDRLKLKRSLEAVASTADGAGASLVALAPVPVPAVAPVAAPPSPSTGHALLPALGSTLGAESAAAPSVALRATLPGSLTLATHSISVSVPGTTVTTTCTETDPCPEPVTTTAAVQVCMGAPLGSEAQASLRELHKRLAVERKALRAEAGALQLPAADVATLQLQLAAAEDRRRQQETAKNLEIIEVQTQLTRCRKELSAAKDKCEKLDVLHAKHQVLQAKLEELQRDKKKLVEMMDTMRLQASTEQARLTQEAADREAAMAQKSTEEVAAVTDKYLAMMEAVRLEKEQHAEKYAWLDMERCRLQEEIHNLKGNIRVFCRVRPQLPSEREAGGPAPSTGAGHALVRRPGADAADATFLPFEFPDAHRKGAELTVVKPPAPGVDGVLRKAEPQKFSFDRVFAPSASQEDIFAEVQGLVNSVADGRRVSIFAYGATGSGKTHTMVGSESTPGLTPRCMDLLFKRIQFLTGDGWDVALTVEALEIYNEALKDLLATDGGSGRLLEAKLTGVSGITTVEVSSPEEARAVMDRATKTRTTASTHLNDVSSRSHMIITLRLRCSRSDAPGTRREGELHLIDLAGSENLKHSCAGEEGTSATARETKSINLSLATLTSVIKALQAKQQHIPYRDSKLTTLLQNSLSNGAKTLMICNVAPRVAQLQESVNTLRFAASVAQVTTTGRA